MPDSKDYRLYLESEFKGLHSLMNAQFETVHERLDKIEVQTTKTNGRVTQLELEVHDDLPHTKDGCPQRDVIEKIHDIVLANEAVKSNEEKKEVVAHSDKTRWIMLAGILVTIILSILSNIRTNKNHEQITGLKTEVDMINTPVRTRGGVIQWYPSGVVIDSLKKK